MDFEATQLIQLDFEARVIRFVGPPDRQCTFEFAEMYTALKAEWDKAPSTPVLKPVFTAMPMGPLQDLRLIPTA